MAYIVYHARAQGESHKDVKPPKPCQDYAYSFSNNGTSLIAVADGHGDSRYFRSERGSKFAVEVVIKCVARFIDYIKKNRLQEELFDKYLQADLLSQLAKSIVCEWRDEVEKDIEANPFSEEEYGDVPEKYRDRYQNGEGIEKAYGTTLLAVLQRDDEFWLGIHIGDGRCVAIDRQGEYSQPIPWDERCFLNKTTSLCDADALSAFRFCLLSGDQIPLATFVASDGIDDCFSCDNDFEQLYQNFYSNIVKIFMNKSVNAAKNELRDFLPVLSSKGSKDDMSVALLMDIEALRNLYREDGTVMKPDLSREIPNEMSRHEIAEIYDIDGVDSISRDIVEVLLKASDSGGNKFEIKLNLLGLKIKKLFVKR